MDRSSCIFCKVADGAIPASMVYEDDLCCAFADLEPQAPIHLLVIPREHIDSLDKAQGRSETLLGHLLIVAAKIARQEGFATNGYRVVLNTNGDGGQTVFHLHVHLLAGRSFIFPPG